MAQIKLYLANAIFSTEINEKWHNLNEKWHNSNYIWQTQYLQPHIGGRHPVLYFTIQVTEKYNTAMYYRADLWALNAENRFVGFS